jgi:mono/diheme cytochrome c family protein
VKAALATIGLLCGLAGVLGGCDQRMIRQPKDKAYGASGLFANGRVEQIPPAGTVARDTVFWDLNTAERPPMSAELLARGRERFDIFCAPCHGRAGDGDGMIVERGMPRPPDFHSARLRDVADRHILQVITNGYGAMYAYADRVPPSDRWAITGYVRALQLSRNAELAALPEELRQRFEDEAE